MKTLPFDGTMPPMPNIASLLKSEISRVARKEIRTEVTSLKKAVASHRSEIAALKRRTQALEQMLKRVTKIRAGSAAAAAGVEAPAKATRFSAKGLKSQRTRLGLSARDCGRLLGVSGLSVYNWEDGKARPRDRHLAAIASLKSMSKKQASALLEAADAA